MIIGLDLSLANTGVCYLIEGKQTKPFNICIERSECSSDEDRLLSLTVAITMVSTPRQEGIDLIVIESLSFGSNTGSGSQIQALSWMVRCELVKANLPFLMVAPSQLKKFIAGKGNAEKSLVMMNVLKLYHVECKDDNQADAVGLAKIGAAYLGIEECRNTAQREVIEALKGPKVKKARKKRGGVE